MKAIVTATARTSPQFYDVDSMRVVWHGYYPRFFELGRVAVMDRIGYGYQAMVDSGFAWPIVDMQIKYAQPVKLHQEIEIEAGITEWENRLKIAFLITDATTGQRLTRGYAVQVAVDMQTEQMLWETPPALREKLAPYLV
ncbi:MAG: acyl-CoA thioesterase [Alphaproteobacteria bacterium]|nr:acyl-CoA thioesterase [Alphaproteobacteria bacterium]